MIDHEFQQLVNDVRKKYTDLQIGGYLKLSSLTIKRWSEGKGIPHPVAQTTFNFILKELRDKNDG